MSNKVEAAMGGKKCTCTRDHDEQTSTVDPDCPFHGNGAWEQTVSPGDKPVEAELTEDEAIEVDGQAEPE